MRTVCIVNNLSFELEPTVANRLIPYINVLLFEGHKVILVTCDKNKALIENENFEHIMFNADENRPRTFLKRALYEHKEAKTALNLAKNLNAETYLISIPSMFLLFNLKILKRSSIILDIRDLTWHYLSNKKLLQSFARQVFESVARRMYRHVAIFSVTNDTEASYISSLGYRVVTNYNGISKSQFEDLLKLEPCRNSSNITLTYVGKVGVAQDLDYLIEVAKKLKNVTFNIVGYGPMYEDFSIKVADSGANNILVPGSASWAQIIEHYRNSHILFAQLTEDYSGAMPSKLYQYLCASRYIIYGGGGQAKDMLNTFENTKVIEPNSVEQLISAVSEFLNMQLDNTAFDRNRQKIFNAYIRETNTKKVTNQIK